MVVYAEFELSAESFRIGRAFGRLSDVEVELDRIVPGGESVVPYIWVQGADADDVRRVTREHNAVEQISALAKEDREWTLFRVVWNRRFRDLIVRITEADVALLSGRGTSDRWQFELRAAERKPIADFGQELRENEVEVTVRRVYEISGERGQSASRLTESQREALQIAYSRGYFKEPREEHLDDLADMLGISRQAFSGRIRRGIHNLLSDEFDGPGELNLA